MSTKAILPQHSAGGRYLFLCEHNNVPQHDDKLVAIVTKTEPQWDRQCKGTVRTVKKSIFTLERDKRTKEKAG